MLQAYKEILKFYDNSDALRKGEMESFATNDVLAFTRKTAEEEVFVIINMRNQTVTYTIEPDFQDSVWKDAFTGIDLTLTGSIDLEPYDYKVLKK